MNRVILLLLILFELLIQCAQSGFNEVFLWSIGSRFVNPRSTAVLSPVILSFYIQIFVD